MDIKQISCPSCHKTNKVPSERLADKPKCGACKNPLFSASPIDVNQGDFNKHIQNCDLPILVDFWAGWCAPCKMMTPTLKQLAQQLDGKIQILKVETDQQPELSQRYNIRSLPTLALFKNGKEVTREAGAMTLTQITDWLNGKI